MTYPNMQQPKTETAKPVGDVQAALDAGMTIGKVQVNPLPNGMPFVVIPEGAEVHFLEPDHQISEPHRKTGTVKLRDAKSFMSYVMQEKSADTRIFATLDPAKFQAVFNDHGEYPNFKDYRAEFVCNTSREWKTWSEKDRKSMSQLSFAELLEDNLPDIILPSGADMLEVALNFEATKTANFRSVQKLRDGSVNFAWVDETAGKDGGTVKVPESFTLRLPVFENGTPYEITARLKYRVSDGKLAIWYELVRPHKVIEAAFREVWAAIEAKCGEVLLGTPE